MTQVPDDIAARLADHQGKMVEALKLLTSEERLEQARTVVIQQAMMLHSIDQLNNTMTQTGKQLETAVIKLNGAFWGLMKVPVAVTVIACASWAFLYMDKISQNTWLIMIGVAVFPWLGESITAISKIIRGSNGGEKK